MLTFKGRNATSYFSEGIADTHATREHATFFQVNFVEGGSYHVRHHKSIIHHYRQSLVNGERMGWVRGPEDAFVSVDPQLLRSVLKCRGQPQLKLIDHIRAGSDFILHTDVQEHSGVLKCVKWFSMFWFYLCDS